jgi:hypothetical protein
MIRIFANLAAAALQDERVFNHPELKAWSQGRKMAYITAAKLLAKELE